MLDLRTVNAENAIFGITPIAKEDRGDKLSLYPG